jgi:hypothetical protein
VPTGTPFENRLLELDSILEWLDRRPLQPLWRLLPCGKLDGGQGLRHLDVLRARLQPVLLRRRRQEGVEAGGAAVKAADLVWSQRCSGLGSSAVHWFAAT